MRTNKQAIKQYQQKQKELLLQEIKQFGDFKSQLKALQSFREELKPFYRWKLLDRFVGYRIKKIKSGDVIDHHITAYFAPLTFKRKSWGGGRIAP